MSGPVPNLHPTQDAAAARPAPTGLAALFSSSILRDGELVLLILKPSLWFIPLQSLIFSALVALFAVGAALLDGHVGFRDRFYFEIGLLLIALRLMWASLQWMGRLYVLTNHRILRLSGVFSTDIFDCPLRKVAEARRAATAREKIFALGSILILPCDNRPPAMWQTVARPAQVQAQIAAAISRAKQ